MALISEQLAQELKDAGYPQNTPKVMGVGDVYLERPTLDELIEACNNKLDHVFADLSQMSDMTWQADMWDSDKKGYGSTPEEAVARLYIAIHKK